MKKLILLVIICILNFNAYSQRKKDLIKEINGYYSSIVSNATYDKPQKEVWNALYTVIKDEYQNITKESESRGYIEAKHEEQYFKSYISAEVLGESPNLKVSISIVEYYKIATSYTPLTYSDLMLADTDNKRLKFQMKLFEAINGDIELPAQLKEKIDKYNLTQEKEKNKVIKNVDY